MENILASWGISVLLSFPRDGTLHKITVGTCLVGFMLPCRHTTMEMYYYRCGFLLVRVGRCSCHHPIPLGSWSPRPVRHVVSFWLCFPALRFQLPTGPDDQMAMISSLACIADYLLSSHLLGH